MFANNANLFTENYRKIGPLRSTLDEGATVILASLGASFSNQGMERV
jgi:hypothetical protein